MHYDHNICMYYDLRKCIKSYRSHAARNSQRGIQGAKPLGRAGDFGGPPGPPGRRAHTFFHIRSEILMVGQVHVFV